MAHQLYVLQVLTFNLLEDRMMTKMDPQDQVNKPSCYAAEIASPQEFLVNNCGFSFICSMLQLLSRVLKMVLFRLTRLKFLIFRSKNAIL